MKTYSESVGEPPFDWRAALLDAKATESDSQPDLTGRATGWVTCACGNLCEAIPRDHRGTPLDPELYNLGVFFMSDVSDAMWSEALDTLDRIEARSAELLAQIHKP